MRLRRGALSATLLLLLACPAAAQEAGESAAAREALARLEARYAPDALAVTRALAARLRGFAAPPERFDVGFAAPGPLDALAADYAADPLLLVESFTFTAYGAAAGHAEARALRGLISFTDSLQRRRTVDFAAEYEIAGERIAVRRAVAEPYYPEVPAVAVLFVPARDFPPDFWREHGTLYELLMVAAERALSFATPWRLPRAPDDYFVFAFFFDELAAEATVDLLVSDTPEGPAGDASPTTRLRQGGWQVAVAEARFAFAAEPSIYFKATHTPARAAGTPTLLAGVFSNRIPAAREEVNIAVPTVTAVPEAPSPEAPAAAAPAASDGNDIETRLETLKHLFERGLISEDEYAAKRRAMLDEL